MTDLFHATSDDQLASIFTHGLQDRSYWGEANIHAYYRETISDEEKNPATLRLPLSVLEGYTPMPDRPGLEEPLTYTLGMSEEDVWEAWEGSDNTWQDCLALIGSIQCHSAIPADVLREHNPALAAMFPKVDPDASRPKPR